MYSLSYFFAFVLKQSLNVCNANALKITECRSKNNGFMTNMTPYFKRTTFFFSQANMCIWLHANGFKWIFITPESYENNKLPLLLTLFLSQSWVKLLKGK